MKRLLLLLLFASASFAACDFASETFAKALPIIGAALMLGVAVSALAYAAGSMVHDARLLVFSKDELFHIFVSALLVISIQGIFTGTCFITSDLLGGEDPLDYSVEYLRSLRSEGTTILTNLMRASINEKFRAAFVFGYYLPFIGGETFSADAFHNAYSRHLELTFDFVMMGYVSAGVQYELMSRLGSIIMGMMLPLGILLRSLPKVRDAGNVVIALAFAAYIILPFAYSATASYAAPECDGSDAVFGGCGDGTGLGAIANYVMKTILLPNLVIVVFATSAGAMVKIAKVIP